MGFDIAPRRPRPGCPRSFYANAWTWGAVRTFMRDCAQACGDDWMVPIICREWQWNDGKHGFGAAEALRLLSYMRDCTKGWSDDEVYEFEDTDWVTGEPKQAELPFSFLQKWMDFVELSGGFAIW